MIGSMTNSIVWQVHYNVTVGNDKYFTDENSVLVAFSQTGYVPITVVAYNHVTMLSVNITLECIDKIQGLAFKAGANNRSSSLYGQTAQFLFTMQNGLGYSCQIDYGDNALDSFDDSSFNYNNTFFSHDYIRCVVVFVGFLYSFSVGIVFLAQQYFLKYIQI